MRLPFLGVVAGLALATPAGASVYTFTTLSVPGALPSYFGTQALGINDAGQVVGTYTSSSSLQGFLFSQTSATYTIFNDPASTNGTIAQGINDTGQVVGHIPYLPADAAFLRDPASGAFTIINSQSNQTYLAATGINNAGLIAGYYTDSGISSFAVTSFVLNPATGAYTILQDPNSQTPNFTIANGINNAGQVVGYFEDNNGVYNGFLFDPTTGTYTTLSDPDGTNNFAQGINNSGQIVGYYYNGLNTEGFVLDLTTGIYTTLSAPDAIATFAEGINDAGQIVGSFEDANYVHNAFITTSPASVPVSEPASVVLLGAGVFGLGVARHARRRRRTSAG